MSNSAKSGEEEVLLKLHLPCANNVENIFKDSNVQELQYRQ